MNGTDKMGSVTSAYRDQGLLYVFGRSIEEALRRLPGTRSAYWRLAPAYYKKRYTIHGDWTAPIEVLKLARVDPDRITHITKRNVSLSSGRRNNIGSVQAGRCDNSDRLLDDEILFSSLTKRLQENQDWPDTELYQYTLQKISEGGSFWHDCATEQELKERCRYVDQLYRKYVKNAIN